MTAPNPTRQKAARSTLGTIFTNASNVWVIHYSCESFYDRPEGRSPRITSIALRKLDTAQTISFSIHKVAETRKVPFSDINECYDCLEREMLQNFYGHLRNFQQTQYLHWNMRDLNYGFQAIEHRFRVLANNSDEPYVVEDNKKMDLARLLIDIYGIRYIGHPRLETLLEKNSISRLGFLTGAEEAKAFEDKEFVALHQSTLRKVDVIANIAERAHDRSLKTNTSWWDMRGGGIIQFLKWLVENPLSVFVTFLVSIGLAAIGLVVSCRAYNRNMNGLLIPQIEYKDKDLYLGWIVQKNPPAALTSDAVHERLHT